MVHMGMVVDNTIDKFLLKYHKCIPNRNVHCACQGCTFMAVTLGELLTHARGHIPREKQSFKCNRCDFLTQTEAFLNSHIQTNHKVLKVNIDERIELPCDQCNYKCYLNIQLKKHKNAVHRVAEPDLKYKCASCDFSSNHILHMWEHRTNNHPQQTPNF